MPDRPHIDAIVDEVLRSEERRTRELASRPPVINIEGRVFEVTPDGTDLAHARDRQFLDSMAQTRADKAVAQVIRDHNRQVHPTARQPEREATDNERAATYRQLIAAGHYRAAHGRSSDQEISLGDILNGELG